MHAALVGAAETASGQIFVMRDETVGVEPLSIVVAERKERDKAAAGERILLTLGTGPLGILFRNATAGADRAAWKRWRQCCPPGAHPTW